MSKNSSSTISLSARLQKFLSGNLGWPIIISLGYLLTHFAQLLVLPVFADEAIYIRWSQLIIDDWHQYLFFPMNDGKTPLFIWSLIPFQFLISNQLLAGRVLAVLIGFAQIWVMYFLLRALGASKRAGIFGMALTTILPFWFTYHRLALMDGMMVLGVSASVLGLIQLVKLAGLKQSRWPSATFGLSKPELLWTIFTGVSFGAALWSKLPAIFLSPLFVLAPIFLWQGQFASQPFSSENRKLVKNFLFRLLPFALSGLIGLLIFFSLKTQPVFGQLFSRSRDFSFSFQEVLLQGKWQTTLPRWNYYLGILTAYLTVPVVLLAISGLFIKSIRQKTLFLLLGAATLATPFWWLGKVVFPRYLLPAGLFLTLAAALNLDVVIKEFVEKQQKLGQKMLAAVVIALLLSGIVAPSLMFMGYSLFDINQIPFIKEDREQYLEEWSAGQGVVEAVNYITQQAKDHSIAVATEGSFGTLPDGVLLYFHRKPVNNIYIEGIGQPVYTLSPEFKIRAKKFDQVILLVNSHRMKMPLPPQQKIAEYCRPNHAPCFQIWDITNQAR